MEVSAERIIQEKKRIDLMIPLCAVISLMGAITGTVVYSRAFSDSDVQAYISAQQLLPRDFGGYFMRVLVSELILQAAIVLLGMFVAGWVFVLPVVFYGGLGAGVSVCCVCQHSGWFGAVYAFAVIVVPFLCFIAARSLLCGSSMALSHGMFMFSMGKHRSGGRHLLSMAIKIPLCGVIDIIAAALAAFFRTVLHPIIG